MLNAFRALSFAAVITSLPLFAQASPETYILDPSHTQVVWNINHFGFSNPSGKFASIEGTLTLDEAKPENSKVEATIRIANLFTGLDKLNEHLLGEKFFDAAKFPTATFVSTKVEVTKGKAPPTLLGPSRGETADVTGDLTLRGVTKPVTLHVTLNKIAPNMMQKKTAGFSAYALIKRSDFGMTEYVPDLGDNVLLGIETEANLKE